MILPNSPDAIATLQEWFGYLLTVDTSQQKMLLLVGPLRSGKGTIIRILTALLGAPNVCHPTLASLSENFGMWPLIGKTAAVINDARLSGQTKQALIVERLLSTSGEDSQTIDRKHQAPVTVRLSARMIIVTNEVPMLRDSSTALANRFICLQTETSFLGREDGSLEMKLLEELPGILNWAINGWHMTRLRPDRRFVQPESGQHLRRQMVESSSPVSAFVNECCELAPNASTPKADLFAAWQRWCRGRSNSAGAQEAFGRNLKAAFPAIRDTRPRESGSRECRYAGITLTKWSGWS